MAECIICGFVVMAPFVMALALIGIKCLSGSLCPFGAGSIYMPLEFEC